MEDHISNVALTTLWTTALFACVSSSVILTNRYQPVDMRVLIHDDDSAYSWSYSWNSLHPTSVAVTSTNAIEDYFHEIPQQRHFLPTSFPIRFAGFEPEYIRGWAGAGSRWNGQYPVCENGLRQSPINILTSELEVARHKYPPLQFNGYWNRPQTVTLINEGDTIKLEAEWPEGFHPTISGGPLHGEYQFLQLHFHWGSRSSFGSEHTFDNISFPIEMHAVHFKKEYGSDMNANTKPDGLAVLGYLFTVSEYDNLGLGAIVRELYRVSNAVEEETMVHLQNAFNLADLVVPFSDNFITYQGSLTTPPCSEIVTWIISTKIQKISEFQLDAFRSVSTSRGQLQNNFRTTQSKNERIIEYVV